MEFLILLAILPGIVVGLFIYKADQIEKEPKRELLKAFLFGIIAIFLTLFFSYLFGVVDIEIHYDSWIEVFLYSFLGIALIEEFSKWLCSYLFLRKNRNYNYLFDGIVYITFISLGFATIENIFYTFAGGIFTGLLRAVTTVPVHAFFGIISGYCFSLSRKYKLSSEKRKAKTYFLCSLLFPVLLHGFYDFCLLTQNVIFFLIYLFFVVILYSISIYKKKKLKEIDAPFIPKK